MIKTKYNNNLTISNTVPTQNIEFAHDQIQAYYGKQFLSKTNDLVPVTHA